MPSSEIKKAKIKMPSSEIKKQKLKNKN